MEKDITNNTYNHLTALHRVYGYANGKDNYWLFQCDCGNTTIAKKYDVTHGVIKSCGCASVEMMKKSLTKHGKNPQRLYYVWNGMIHRCYEITNKGYKRYGGRGIRVCEEWRGENGFINFRKWAFENGYDANAPKGECTIDRIDNNGDYEPSNCRWTNKSVQANNRECVNKITLKGITHSIAEWARMIGLSEAAIRHRLNIQKLSVEEALNPIDRRLKNAHFTKN